MVVVCLAGCVNENPVEQTDVISIINGDCITRVNTDGEDSIFENDKELLFVCGYDTVGMVEYNDCYFLESKYRITPELMEDLRNREELVNVCGEMTGKLSRHYQQMYFRVSADFGNRTSYMNSPAEIWNSIGECGLSFQTEDLIDATGEEMYPYVVDVVFSSNSIPSDQLVAFTPIGNVWEIKPPYGRIDINTSHVKWELIANNAHAQRDLFLAHVIASLVGFADIEENNNTGSIFLSEDLLSREYLNNYLQLWNGITEDDKREIRMIYPEVSEINPYSITFSPELFGENDKCLYVNTDYSVKVSYNGNCCGSEARRYLEVYKDGEKLSMQLLSLDNGGVSNTILKFTTAGIYSIRLVVVEDGLSYFSHESNLEVYVIEDSFSTTLPLDGIQLSYPYLFRYNYIHPLHPNAVVEYSIEEVLFDVNNEQQNATIGNAGPHKVIVFYKEGCYFLHIRVKEYDVELSHKIINITKLENYSADLQIEFVTESSTVQPYSEESTPTGVFEYEITHPNINTNVRTAYIFEYELETRRCQYGDERRVDRQWSLHYNTICFSNEETSQTSYLYRTGSMTDGLFFPYYTGYVYCPVNGVREVKTTNVLDLPKSCRVLTVVNDEGRVRMTDLLKNSQ